MVWQITVDVSDEVKSWVREVENALPPEDTAPIIRIDFLPSKDMAGATGLSYPHVAIPIIQLSLDMINDKQWLQATLAHEVGHHVDYHITRWSWHQLPRPEGVLPEGHLPNEPLLNQATDYIMYQMAEFFASGYAIKQGFMTREGEILRWMPYHAPHIRKILTGEPSPFE